MTWEADEALLHANERLPGRSHQRTGVRALMDHPAFALFDEVGCGKSKQVVDAAQLLYQHLVIDTVVVLTPGFARSTWADPDPVLGEVAKHAWASTPNIIHDYRGDADQLHQDFADPSLHWVVSNYELIRREQRLLPLMRALRTRRVWLVCDEGWALKGWSQQMRAVRRLRAQCAARCTLLNGTPLADGKPSDLYYQLQVLDPDIIAARSRAEFQARYCMMGGFQGRQVIGHHDLDDLNRRIAPHVLTRRTRDCFDLPPMLDPVTISATLSPSSWDVYRQMRDDMVAWLNGQPSISLHAVVKALRLAQITSGYLGGLEDDPSVPEMGTETPDLGTMPSWLREKVSPDTPPLRQDALTITGPQTRELGREKLDALLEWVSRQDPTLTSILVWCRFRAELERTANALRAIFPDVYTLQGGQSREDRDRAKRALAPGSRARVAVVGNTKAGGASLNFSGTHTAVYMSHSPSLLERTQSIGRIERPGATRPMLIVDVVATGPKGQRTIDHHILRSLRQKDDMARWTVDQWRSAIRAE
jgi:SNF2 family DNA or RNA helicase